MNTFFSPISLKAATNLAHYVYLVSASETESVSQKLSVKCVKNNSITNNILPIERINCSLLVILRLEEVY